MNAIQMKGLLHWILVSAALVACGSPTTPSECGPDDAVDLGSGRCLVFQDGRQLNAYRTQIVGIVSRTLQSADRLLPIGTIEIHVFADEARTIPGYGLGGYAPAADRVDLIFDPLFPDLATVIDDRLLGLVAHELHHAARWATVGYGNTLLEAAVSEGLADHFSLQLTSGSPPPWSLALQGEELRRWTETASETWNDTGYEHPRWFFGDGVIPPWTGYAVGFALVEAYLDQDPTRTASGLVAEPAERFVAGR